MWLIIFGRHGCACVGSRWYPELKGPITSVSASSNLGAGDFGKTQSGQAAKNGAAGPSRVLFGPLIQDTATETGDVLDRDSAERRAFDGEYPRQSTGV